MQVLINLNLQNLNLDELELCVFLTDLRLDRTLLDL